ncbi:MAG: aminotransferase class I/II-fold pyridoxal phosphate-dependent enzyme, partial [Vulcanimicrobiaceae bacterium]
MSARERIARELARIEAAALRREVREALPPGALDFSSNDYLGLSRDPHVLEALRASACAGSGGSRLLAGAHPEHAALERELAAWLGRERVLLFSSGYLAVLGAVATLGTLCDIVYSDRLVHASAIDAIRLCARPKHIYPHATLPPLAAEAAPVALVVSESIFGMDGDALDLAALLGALRPGDLLVLDEAHALGIAGPTGAGAARAFADPRIVVVGTLSKAFGDQGGFVAASRDVVELLVSRARSFIFDTSLAPPLAAAARAALAIVRGAEGERLRERLRANVQL